MRFITPRSPRIFAYSEMSEQLKVYDIDQQGWEHSDKGRDFNVTHVLKELVRARRKDFTNKEVIKNELAPDAIQYGLRMSRWGVFPIDFILPTIDLEIETDAYCNRNNIKKPEIGAWALAEITLAEFSHNLDHASKEIYKDNSDEQSIIRASRLLLYFAEYSADEYNFDLQESFTNRLTNLRQRFNIPQPETLQ